MKTQINSILIPTDFSELSESALKVGVAIAKRQNAEITLLHVVSSISLFPISDVILPGTKIVPDVKKTMENKIKELAKKIQNKTGIRSSGKILVGHPSDRICQFAIDEDFSLIVMGTHGTSGLREFFMGSEAFRVVKNSTRPVLTIPGNWQKTDFEKVLFPIRLHPQALDKYFYARPIIEKNNSQLILLGLAENKKYNNLKEISQLMAQLKYQLHNDNIAFQTEINRCENFPAKVIEMSNDKDADLIILTANLDYDFKAYFLGPYVQQIVNHSSRPVLSIKPDNIPADQTNTAILAARWGRVTNYDGLLSLY